LSLVKCFYGRVRIVDTSEYRDKQQSLPQAARSVSYGRYKLF
jgi:hypothetical protein